MKARLLSWPLCMVLASAFASAPSSAGSTGREVIRASSPGGAEDEGAMAHSCPTFHWSAMEGAEGYRLVIYALPAFDEPMQEHEVPAGVTGWTPGPDECLPLGGRFAWAVRALREGSEPSWSEPRFFQVPDSTVWPGRAEISRVRLTQAGAMNSVSIGSGEVQAATFVGDGAGVTGVSWSTLADVPEDLADGDDTGAIACNWSGTRWLSSGWDGVCAFTVGARATCAGGVVTSLQYEATGCDAVP